MAVCQKLACHNQGDSSFTGGVNNWRPGAVAVVPPKSTTNAWCQRWSTQPKSVGYRGTLGLPKVSELVKGRTSCHKTLLQYTNGSLNKWRSALCADSQLPGEGPTDVEDAPTPAQSKPDDDDDIPVNNFSVMSERVFLGWISTKY